MGAGNDLYDDMSRVFLDWWQALGDAQRAAEKIGKSSVSPQIAMSLYLAVLCELCADAMEMVKTAGREGGQDVTDLVAEEFLTLIEDRLSQYLIEPNDQATHDAPESIQ